MALEKRQVERRFQTIFGCPPGPSHVLSTPGGYRVEGCGRVAHFRCFDNDHHVDEADLIGALVHGALDADTCIMEHSEAYTSASTPKLNARPEVAVQRESKEVSMKARVLLAGGHLRLFARPAKYPEHLLLTVHRIAPLSPEPCAAALFMDGAPIELPEVRRTSDHEVSLVVRAADLREAHRAVRLSGSVCGFDFELDAHGRETVGLFEARLREEIARRQQALTSGAERPRDG
jgi:hypothetical protein